MSEKEEGRLRIPICILGEELDGRTEGARAALSACAAWMARMAWPRPTTKTEKKKKMERRRKMGELRLMQQLLVVPIPPPMNAL